MFSSVHWDLKRRKNSIYLTSHLKQALLVSKYRTGVGNLLYHPVKATKKNKMECYIRKKVAIGERLLSTYFGHATYLLY